MQTSPLLLSSCAYATTAEEARYRIDGSIAPARATRIFALDEAGLEVTRAAAMHSWFNARFFAYEGAAGLRHLDGHAADLTAELAGVDAAVMVGGPASDVAAAAAIGAACFARGIMTAGLVLTAREQARPALAAMRPYARVLLVPADPGDLQELLTAIRA
jgi:hypothetical protein